MSRKKRKRTAKASKAFTRYCCASCPEFPGDNPLYPSINKCDTCRNHPVWEWLDLQEKETND